MLFYGGQQTRLYLKNGYDLKLTFDAGQFYETIRYAGRGESENNYLNKLVRLQGKIIDFESLMALSPADFDSSIKSINTQLSSLLSDSKGIEEVFAESQKKDIEKSINGLILIYNSKQQLLVLNGKESPKFKGYENFSGGSVSLDDLKGRYVYIDLWATWCAPCRAEIPFLKEVESLYHDKNIVFVSISTDRQKDYEKWRKMVTEGKLSGIQLWAREDKTFTDAYMVAGIPRFILIDPKGYVISPDAPRPSEKKLIDLLDSLHI